ncbi:PEP-utilizing enzyme [Ornithinimicrobium kibberense]|uniref:PEP-utilizing enzyme n=1 Tax=Ornithinimicrobium kibberense TaxID=282060 RepID=UPI0036174284
MCWTTRRACGSSPWTSSPPGTVPGRVRCGRRRPGGARPTRSWRAAPSSRRPPSTPGGRRPATSWPWAPRRAEAGRPARCGSSRGRPSSAVCAPGRCSCARRPTPGGRPLFQRAAAVVVDHGGMASHAAIVAREYGIPAVMGTGTGTRELPDGLRVVVDGDRGAVWAAPSDPV